jgi:hypothetical protein
MNESKVTYKDMQKQSSSMQNVGSQSRHSLEASLDADEVTQGMSATTDRRLPLPAAQVWLDLGQGSCSVAELQGAMPMLIHAVAVFQVLGFLLQPGYAITS